jgi:hypothetical protein
LPLAPFSRWLHLIEIFALAALPLPLFDGRFVRRTDFLYALLPQALPFLIDIVHDTLTS